MNEEIDRNNLIIEQNNLLRKNLEVSEELLKKTTWMHSYLRWSRVFGFINVILIAIPIVVGFVYLPPMIKDFLESLTSLYTK